MKGIVLTSHGKLAQGMHDTLQIFTGENEQIQSLCLLPEEDIETYLTKLMETIDRVDSGEGVLVFCDLLFGTPCNCSARLLNDEKYKNRISVITGMNLPMVLEYAGGASQMCSADLVNTGQKGIIDFNQMLEAQHKG